MSDIDRHKHFHPWKIFTCPCSFEIAVFAKTVKTCFAMSKIFKRKNVFFILLFRVKRTLFFCEWMEIRAISQPFTAISIGCLEISVEFLHYNKNTFMTVNVQDYSIKLCEKCFYRICTRQLKYLPPILCDYFKCQNIMFVTYF